MSVSSNIPLLLSGEHHAEGYTALETVPDSPFEEEEGLKMATPAEAGRESRPQDIPLAPTANSEEEKKQGPPSLQSQQSTISQAANVKGGSDQL